MIHLTTVNLQSSYRHGVDSVQITDVPTWEVYISRLEELTRGSFSLTDRVQTGNVTPVKKRKGLGWTKRWRTETTRCALPGRELTAMVIKEGQVFGHRERWFHAVPVILSPLFSANIHQTASTVKGVSQPLAYRSQTFPPHRLVAISHQLHYP